MAMLKAAKAAEDKKQAQTQPADENDQGAEGSDQQEAADQQSAQDQSDAQPDSEDQSDSQDAGAAGGDDDQSGGDSEDSDSGNDGSDDQDGAPPSGDSSEPGSTPATPEQEAEFRRAVTALHTVLYTNNQIGRSVVKMVQPAMLVDTTAKACMLLVSQLDKRLHLDADVIPQFTMATVDEVMYMIQRVKDIQYTKAQQTAVLGATFEGVLRIFGVPPAQAHQFLASMSDQQKQQQRQKYVGLVNEAKNAPQEAVSAGPAPTAQDQDQNDENSVEPPQSDDQDQGDEDQDQDQDQSAPGAETAGQGGGAPSPEEGQ